MDKFETLVELYKNINLNDVYKLDLSSDDKLNTFIKKMKDYNKCVVCEITNFTSFSDENVIKISSLTNRFNNLRIIIPLNYKNINLSFKDIKEFMVKTNSCVKLYNCDVETKEFLVSMGMGVVLLESKPSNKAMVQYGIWPNCCNKCDFCLIKEEFLLNKEQQLDILDKIKQNIGYIDWKDKFSYGISLLGGELYYIKDKEVQDKFMELIDVIIEKILKVSTNPNCRYSTVTNGLYEPSFLYRVIDRIVDKVGIDKVDMNFSYDLKHRFKSEEDRLKVLKNINDFHNRYNYTVGVQMILTQYVINMWKEGQFDVNRFIEENIKGNNFCFLYPHPIHRGDKSLKDFQFNRRDFLDFLTYLRETNYQVFLNFINSTKNSAVFKYTGYTAYSENFDSVDNQPKLLDGKGELSKCGHSVLYKCYADSEKCMFCDLNSLYGDEMED